jgi:hypothetical protein
MSPRVLVQDPQQLENPSKSCICASTCEVSIRPLLWLARYGPEIYRFLMMKTREAVDQAPGATSKRAILNKMLRMTPRGD